MLPIIPPMLLIPLRFHGGGGGLERCEGIGIPAGMLGALILAGAAIGVVGHGGWLDAWAESIWGITAPISYMIASILIGAPLFISYLCLGSTIGTAIIHRLVCCRKRAK